MHDIHFHTNLSSCAKRESTLKVMLRHLQEAGVTTAGVANHLWDSKVPGATGWYAPQNVEHVLSVKKEYASLSDEERCGIKLYFGCETEYVGQGRVALKPGSAELFPTLLRPEKAIGHRPSRINWSRLPALMVRRMLFLLIGFILPPKRYEVLRQRFCRG